MAESFAEANSGHVIDLNGIRSWNLPSNAITTTYYQNRREYPILTVSDVVNH